MRYDTIKTNILFPRPSSFENWLLHERMDFVSFPTVMSICWTVYSRHVGTETAIANIQINAITAMIFLLVIRCPFPRLSMMTWRRSNETVTRVYTELLINSTGQKLTTLHRISPGIIAVKMLSAKSMLFFLFIYFSILKLYIFPIFFYLVYVKPTVLNWQIVLLTSLLCYEMD